MLPQFSLLNFPYRVHEVVALARIPHDTGHQHDNKIIDEALNLMDISLLKNRLYTELSGGEKQRVQLARTFAQIWEASLSSRSGQSSDSEQPILDDRILLLDEPTTALDLGHRNDLMKAIKSFAQQGVATLMVLHDINLAARFSDRLLALRQGEQVAFGSVTEVITVDNMQRLFNTDIRLIKDPENNAPIIIND